MPFIPAPNIVQVELRCTLASQNIENRFMIDALSAVNSTKLQAITNLVSVWCQATYFDHQTDDVRLVEVVGTDMSSQNGEQYTITPEGTVVGAVTGGTMPNEVSFCISFRSGSRGRSARGRAYSLSVPRAKVAGNFVEATWADGLVGDFTELRNNLTNAGYALAIVSYYSNKALRPGGPVYFLVESFQYADLIVDSMRRRKPGVGT
jgi:hypothetical protein